MTRNHSRALSVGLLAAATSVAMLAQAGDARESAGAIRQMQRLDRETGFVLTDSALLATRDGGATWADVSPLRGLAGVSDAFFLDADRGWLAANTPGRPSRLVVLDTADAGASWREVSIDSSDAPGGRPYAEAQVHFVDSVHGWLLGRLATGAAVSLGTLLRTVDGGESWERLPAPPAAGRIVFASAEHGFMTGAPVPERLYRSLDGGLSWQELALPIPAAAGQALYARPQFTTTQDGTVSVTMAGPRPRLLSFVTRDGGLTWLKARSLVLPAGDYAEPVPAALMPSGDPAAFATGRSIARERSGQGRVLTNRLPSARSGLPGRAAPPRGVPSVRALAVDEDGSGWALVAEGQCDAGTCTQTTRLLALDASGESRDLLIRDGVLRAPGSRGSALTSAATISFNRGFDKCAAGTVAQMRTWMASSPYRDANIYHGGSARACSQTYLTPSWVSSVFQQGWRLIPTWVGPQAPCSAFSNKFSSTPSTARAQGQSEADGAVNAAAALGLGPGTPVYYDMEYYATTTACSAAVRAFVDGWTERVKARGYLSGLYGTATNTQTDWRPGLFTNVPDAVWVAAWACTGSTCSFTPSVYGIPGLSDSYWTNNQRIRQYWGGHNETWGGVTFNIDTNYANGPVAVPDPAARPDLVLASVSTSPASPVAGQAATFSAVVRNAGTVATPTGVAIGVSYRVDGTQVASGTFGTLAAGATLTVTGSGTWTATAGTHTLAAVVDAANVVTEANEGNNQLSRSLTVSGGVAQFVCDDGDGCFALNGPSAYWHRATTCGGTALGYGGDMYWTYVNGSAVSNYVRWTPALGGSGTYAVSVFIPRCDATSQTAKYKIVHGGVTEYRTVNQNAYYDAWVPLGTFAFTGAAGEYVELTDATGESYTTKRLLGFDAVKWVRQ